MNKWKKGMGLILSAAMVVSSLTGCGKIAKEMDSAEDILAVEDVFEDLTGTDLIKHSSTAGKEETVYVMMDANGNPTSTIVSEWLKNPEGQDNLEDVSSLKNIRVVKGNSEFTQNGEALIWQTEGKDVYYQGESDKKLPVDIKVSYELDGKKVSAEELEGATGHVTITFDYTNNTATKKVIHGEECTIYQPFMVLSGMMFDTNKVANVEISKGKTINSGDMTLVFGVAMPGLRESLGIDEMEDADGKAIDIDIPNQVVVDVDVVDFSLMMTLSVVSNNALEELGLDDFDSLDDLKESMGELSDGMDDIIDGATKLRDGVQELSDGTGELSDGTFDLKTGAGDLSDGAHKLLNGTCSVDNGVNTLKKGIESADDGAKQLKAGMDQLQEKIPGLVEGVGSLQNGMTQLSAGLNTLDESLSDTEAQQKMQTLVAGSSAVKDGLGSVSGGLDQIVAGYNPEAGDVATLLGTLDAYATGLEASGDAQNVAYAGAIRAMMNTYQGMYANVSTAAAGADALNTNYAGIDAGINSLVGNMNTVSGAVHQASAGATQVKAGLGQMSQQLPVLEQGIGSLSDGVTALSDGTGKLRKGAKTLAEGTGDLRDGALDLAEGAGKLSDGTKDLDDGVQELVDGVAELLNGSGELKDGVVKFNDEGITKLSDLVNEDLEKFYDRLKAVKDYANEYENLGGCKDGVESTVTFIYKTEGIGE